MSTHMTGPVLNRDKAQGLREWFSLLPMGQEPDLCIYMNDFIATQDYAATDWVITTTEAGAGSATEALAADERSGALLITNDAADDDLDSLQSNEENWTMQSGKQLWMECRLKVSDADQVDLMIGLSITDTTPLDSSDRATFRVTDGSASIVAKNAKNSTETSTASGLSLSDDTYVVLGMYWDGISSLEYYVDRSKVATHTTNVPDDENMAITIHLQNGEAVAKTCTIDYIYVAQER